MTTTAPDRVEVARTVLAALGVTPEELLRTDRPAEQTATRAITVADYLPRVLACSGPAAKTYLPYWRRLVGAHANRALAEVTATDIAVLAAEAQRRAVRRANAANGTGARENFIGAARAFFRKAVDDGLCASNPAQAVPKPRRQESTRRALTDTEVRELEEVIGRRSRDPHLDLLLLRFHLETGARRGGALALRPCDLDDRNSCVRLREKGNTVRWQPVSPSLLAALARHARDRGAAEGEQLFRLRPQHPRAPGLPMSRRRYNTITGWWQADLPWAKRLMVSPHWLRHTAITRVERAAGFAVAHKFAGHAGAADVTGTYVKADITEVARAVERITGEPHPLALACAPGARAAPYRASTQGRRLQFASSSANAVSARRITA